jgi:hypothetical protein
MAQNEGIVGPDGKVVTVSTDGSKERLDVNANVEVAAIGSAEKAIPIFTHSKAETEIGTSDTTIATITDEGFLDFISFNVDDNDVEFILIVDDVERLRISITDLDTPGIYNLRASSSLTTASIFTRGGACMCMEWYQPAYFSTNVILKAKHSSGSSMKGYMVKWRKPS